MLAKLLFMSLSGLSMFSLEFTLPKDLTAGLDRNILLQKIFGWKWLGSRADACRFCILLYLHISTLAYHVMKCIFIWMLMIQSVYVVSLLKPDSVSLILQIVHWYY